jgi:hypothetical protein
VSGILLPIVVIIIANLFAVASLSDMPTLLFAGLAVGWGVVLGSALEAIS